MDDKSCTIYTFQAKESPQRPMKIASLTIDRGDRPKMIKQCKMLIERQTLKPDLEIYVIEPSISNAIDIVPRFRSGWLEAKNNNIDVIAVFESDDWYDSRYLSQMAYYIDNTNTDAIGFDKSLYYNICNQTYQIHSHPNRSSLYTTVFKTSTLDNFIWPKDDYRFLDIPLWKHFKNKNVKLDNSYAIGIKHGEGIRAGIGHRSRMQKQDKNFQFLESIIGKEDIEFYKTFCNG